MPSRYHLSGWYLDGEGGEFKPRADLSSNSARCPASVSPGRLPWQERRPWREIRLESTVSTVQHMCCSAVIGKKMCDALTSCVFSIGAAKGGLDEFVVYLVTGGGNPSSGTEFYDVSRPGPNERPSTTCRASIRRACCSSWASRRAMVSIYFADDALRHGFIEAIITPTTSIQDAFYVTDQHLAGLPDWIATPGRTAVERLPTLPCPITVKPQEG